MELALLTTGIILIILIGAIAVAMAKLREEDEDDTSLHDSQEEIN